MWYNDLFTTLEQNANPEQAIYMAAYMRNRFEFLGISKPALLSLIKPYLRVACKQKEIDWAFIELCWQKPFREAQYTGIEYLSKNQKKLKEKDLSYLKKLIITRSWWDTTDALNKMVGIIVSQHPHLYDEMVKWSLSDNMWLRRVSIIFQLFYKEKTNTQILAEVIKNNLGSKEFFINKAIGWSLRQYSKYNPSWVKDFIEQHREQLSFLSIKEAKKYL